MYGRERHAAQSQRHTNQLGRRGTQFLAVTSPHDVTGAVLSTPMGPDQFAPGLPSVLGPYQFTISAAL
jgi:hypothetical protein